MGKKNTITKLLVAFLLILHFSNFILTTGDFNHHHSYITTDSSQISNDYYSSNNVSYYLIVRILFP